MLKVGCGIQELAVITDQIVQVKYHPINETEQNEIKSLLDKNR